MCRRLIFVASFVLTIVSALTNVANAGSPILKLDINQTNTPTETEEGFVSFTIADSGSQVDGITVELGGTLDSRRRGAPTGIPFEQIYRDFIFSRPGEMTVTLSGLVANTTYEITIYAWDTSSAETRVADWTANGIPVCQTVFDGAQNPPAAEDDYAFTGRATSDITGTILLESAPGEGTREVSGASHPFAFLNALVISSTAPITEARRPDPVDGALHEDTWVNLSWMPGDLAVSHDVYLSDSFDDVNDATVDSPVFRGNQTSASYVAGFPGYAYPEGLVPGTAYYWRIDGVNDGEPNSPWKGNVWSFWIPPRTAYEPTPADGINFALPDVTLSWTAGFGARMHQVYLGDNFDGLDNASGATLQTDVTYTPGTLELGKTYYWRVDEFDAAGATHKGNVWSFKTVPDVAIAEPNLVGLWTFDEGQGATAVDWSGHGNHGKLEGNPQWVDGYELGALELDGSDDVVEVPLQPSITFEQGDSFSVLLWTKTQATPTPQDGIVGNYRTSTDPFWLLIANTDGGATMYVRDVGRAHSTVIASPSKINDGNWHHLAGIRDQQTKRLCLYVDGQLVVEESDETEDINSGQSIWIGDHLNRYYDGLIDNLRIYNKALTVEEISQVMQVDPKLADNPVPDRHVTVDIRDISSLSWSAGDASVSHDVYLGQDRDAIAGADNSSPEFQGNQAGTSLSLAALVEFGGGDYYWRIDEVAADGTVTAGTIWKFTVPDRLIVDDFESYNDIEEGQPGSNRIYLTWVDGFGTTTNGALAGNLDPPFMSQGRSGAQAMPLSYDNAGKTSEATMTLASKKDWTEHGVTKLSIWFSGDSANAADRMFVALGNAIVYHPDDAATQDTGWNEWVIDLQEFANQGVDLANVPSITIGFGTRNAPVPGGGIGTVHFDDIGLIR